MHFRGNCFIIFWGYHTYTENIITVTQDHFKHGLPYNILSRPCFDLIRALNTGSETGDIGETEKNALDYFY